MSVCGDDNGDVSCELDPGHSGYHAASVDHPQLKRIRWGNPREAVQTHTTRNGFTEHVDPRKAVTDPEEIARLRAAALEAKAGKTPFQHVDLDFVAAMAIVLQDGLAGHPEREPGDWRQLDPRRCLPLYRAALLRHLQASEWPAVAVNAMICADLERRLRARGAVSTDELVDTLAREHGIARDEVALVALDLASKLAAQQPAPPLPESVAELLNSEKPGESHLTGPERPPKPRAGG